MTALTAPLARLDRLLARWSMYRLVLGLLGILAVLAVVLAATEVLEPLIFDPGWMLASLAVLSAAATGTNLVVARLRGLPAQTESALITALLLWFLYWPARDLTQLAWLLAPAVLAVVSKHLLVLRGRHLLNPAAAGVLLTVALQELLGIDALERLWSTWWVAAEPLAIPVAVAALLVARRTGLVGYACGFVALSFLIVFAALLRQDMSASDAAQTTLTSWPLVFLAGFMLTEPLTLAARRAWRAVAVVVAALVVSLPQIFALVGVDPVEPWIFGSWTELALVAANLVAFAAAPALAGVVHRTGVRQVGEDIVEVTFRSDRPVDLKAGQYVELEVPHARPDSRGSRRWLSVTTPAGTHEFSVATRVPEGASSFKRALVAEPVAPARIRWAGGDFVVPAGTEPLLLVAGGIGITPFLAHLDSLMGRDVTLVWAISGGEVPFRDELIAAGIEVVVVAPEPVEIAPTWRHVRSAALTPQILADVVPDLPSRAVLISGRPEMVTALRRGLRGQVASLRTDIFIGY